MPMKDLSPWLTSPLAIVKVAKEIDATKKERRGMCREERTLGMGGKKKKKRAKGRKGEKNTCTRADSEWWPLTPNQEGQAPVPCEMTRYLGNILPYCCRGLADISRSQKIFFPDGSPAWYGVQWPFLGSERIELLLLLLR